MLVFFVTELPIDIFPEKSCHTHRKREEVDHCCTAAVVQCQLFSVQMPAIIRENVYWKLCFPVLDQSHLQCLGNARGHLSGEKHLSLPNYPKQVKLLVKTNFNPQLILLKIQIYTANVLSGKIPEKNSVHLSTGILTGVIHVTNSTGKSRYFYFPTFYRSCQFQ